MKSKRACFLRAAKPVRNRPLALNHPEPPADEESLTASELAEIERVLELMSDGECAMGVDYPEGPMSPSGCPW